MGGDRFNLAFLSGIGLSISDNEEEEWCSDLSVVEQWIAKSTENPTSARLMRKELERLVFWSVGVRNKTLLRLNAEDFDAYARFLRNPTPSSIWVSRTKYPKSHEKWRPFSSSLSSNSLRYSLIHIRSFIKWAVDNGFADSGLVVYPNIPKIPRDTHGAIRLSDEAKGSLVEAVEGQIKTKKVARDRLLFAVLLEAGLMRFEAARANFGDVIRDDDGRCWIQVIGSYGRYRQVPITNELYTMIEQYHLEYCTQAKHTPLIQPITGKCRHLDEGTLWAIINKVAKMAIETALSKGSYELARELKKASAYMLRHTCLTKLSVGTKNINVVQRMAGLTSVNSAYQYFEKDTPNFHDDVIRSTKH